MMACRQKLFCLLGTVLACLFCAPGPPVFCTIRNHRLDVTCCDIFSDGKVTRCRSPKALTVAFLALTGVVTATEEAAYVVVQDDGDFELRDYAPQVVAEVVVSGSFSSAANRAFRPLFNYISGENAVRTEIAMTAPVSQTTQS